MRRLLPAVAVVSLLFAGCSYHTSHPGQRVSADELAREESVMFLRPDRYTLLGTRSVSDYVEITYERVTINESGQSVVEVGLRNRGGQHWYDKSGPSVALSVKSSFYESPVSDTGPTGPPVYETNWRPVPIPRGQTANYKAVCPVRTGRYYQVLITELRHLPHCPSHRSSIGGARDEESGFRGFAVCSVSLCGLLYIALRPQEAQRPGSGEDGG